MNKTMTIELTIDDLIQLQQAAQKFGAGVLVTKTTTGEPVWLHVEVAQARRKHRKRADGAALRVETTGSVGMATTAPTAAAEVPARPPMDMRIVTAANEAIREELDKR